MGGPSSVSRSQYGINPLKTTILLSMVSMHCAFAFVTSTTGIRSCAPTPLHSKDYPLSFPTAPFRVNDAFQTKKSHASLVALQLSGGSMESSSAWIANMLGSDVVTSLFAYGGNVPFALAFGINAVLFTALNSKLRKMLTPEGFGHALALGTLLWTTLGWRGWSVCVLYLFLGSAVTKVKFAEKEKMGIAEGRGGRRGPENIWGSAATALVCAACSVQGDQFLGISSNLYVLGFVASLATKLADTFASEIGKAYGKTTFLITTFEKVDPGTEGAVSLEGTLAALVGGSFLPLFGLGIHMLDSVQAVVLATIAAFLATNAESLIGATLQGKEGFQWMTNEVVNFFNTVIGAGIAIAGGAMLLGM
eukprot:CAMPEP_0198289784 /NCGR_PEP_ID=MMETSP1449-20131203/7862_1 /TAXON_ID=420275 /ORGANISM="Attheya septentrionalis, Strain CCMP2084" /LENGTH=362 /DNA_ID=CAMNT_0043988171 /DNA_START=58 /DNA_END=1146 /DNA_ORIENTATION=+